MGLSRRLRRVFGATLAACVLFTQLAVAAYTCPQGKQESADHQAIAQAASQAIVEAMPDMPDCHGMGGTKSDPAQPTLCKAHCSNDAQSASRTASLEFPVDIAAGPLVRVIELAALQPRAGFAKAQSPAFGPPPPLPIYLALHVLRN